MEGFTKINLETAPSQPVGPKIINNKPKSGIRITLPKKTLIVLGAVAAILVGFGLILVSQVQKVYSDAKATFSQVKITVDALKKQNIVLASEELNKTKESLAQTQKSLDEISYLKFIHVINMYYADSQHLTKAGFYGLSAAKHVYYRNQLKITYFVQTF